MPADSQLPVTESLPGLRAMQSCRGVPVCGALDHVSVHRLAAQGAARIVGGAIRRALAARSGPELRGAHEGEHRSVQAVPPSQLFAHK